ncbi:Transmembrane secretion effector [Marininema mesophilum]|uniref:Transmembrane secretion effector n=2 Tax=Marininema mesophilum TaxID=1048340 RepID=A0A1H3C9P6_9BACL|nr:Transmembrane secretion effector [Marininema mesophilum]
MNLTASFIEGLALFFIALTPNHWVAASLLVIIGGTTTAINVIAPSVNQSIIPKKLFGRVVSVMMLVMTGLVPITQALAGYVIDNTSSNQVFFYGGALELLTAGFAFFIPAVRNYSVQYFKRQGNLQ